MQRIDAALSSGADRLGAMGGQMSEALEQGLRRALDAMAQASAESAGAARTHVEAQLAPLLGTLQELGAEIRKSAADSRWELVEGGRAARMELANAIDGVGGNLARTSANASDQLLRAAENMNAAAARIAAVMEGRAGEIDARMGRIDAALSSDAESMGAIS